MAPIPVSVQLLTRDSAGHLRACLESLRDCDDIVMQDGFSTDETRKIAAAFPNVRVLDQDRRFLDAEGRITDFASMRNIGIATGKHDWILVVDGDEHVHPAFLEEVRAIVAAGTPGVYQAFRRFYVGAEPIMHCSGYPALQIRLFHRSCTEGYGKSVHERLVLHPDVVPRTLRAELPVPMPPVSSLRAKSHRYLLMEVRRGGARSYSWWFRWVLVRNILSSVLLLARLCRIWLVPRHGKRMPLRYELAYIRHSMLAVACLFPPVARRILRQP